MRKNYTLLFLLSLFVTCLEAQYLDVDWAKGQGGTDLDIGISATTDVGGNQYSFCQFKGTADFDPGPGVFNMSTNSLQALAISKFDASGNFLWAKQIGGGPGSFSTSYDIITDAAGNIYLTGEFVVNIDLDPGTGAYNIYANGSSYAVFIVKLDPGGNFIWGKKIGGNDDVQYPYIRVTDTGEVIIAGTYSGTIDFDPGPGIFNLTADPSDLFVVKLDASGNFSWVRTVGGPNWDTSDDFDIDGSGNIFFQGSFYGTADFDPGPGVYNMTAQGMLDMFVLKLDASGNFIWAKQVGGAGGYVVFNFLDVSPSGAINSAGFFSGTLDLDPGVGSSNVTAVGSRDVFVMRLDPLGNFVWGRQVSGTDVISALSIVQTNTGHIYVTGGFLGTVDFDPGPAQFSLTSNGLTDIYVLVLDNLGNFIWVKRMGGAGAESGRSLSSDNTGSVRLTGAFSNTVEFNECLLSNPLTSSGSYDIFTLKLSMRTASVSISSSATTICEGSPVTFTATTTDAGTSPSYQWQVNGINVGADSPTYTANDLADGDRVRVILSSPCLRYVPVMSNSIVINVTPAQTPVVNIGQFPATICYGTTAIFTASAVNGGTQPAFEWRLNGVVAGNNSSFTTNMLDNGDEIFCVMTSNASCLTQATDTSDKIIVKIDPAVCPIGFYMPTGFTPNKDGKNDLCKPLLFGRVVSYQFSVYNRWGQKIFETRDTQKGWDGTIAGALQQTGTFVWFCSFQFKDQPAETRKGTVSLIR